FIPCPTLFRSRQLVDASLPEHWARLGPHEGVAQQERHAAIAPVILLDMDFRLGPYETRALQAQAIDPPFGPHIEIGIDAPLMVQHEKAPGVGAKDPRAIAVESRQMLRIVRFHQRSEEHTSELQSRENLVCRLLLE